MLHHFCKKVEVDHKVSISDSIELVNRDHWEQLTSDGPLFLQIPYLESLENSITTMEFRYVLFYDRSNQPLLAAYCQVIDLDENEESYADWLEQKVGAHIAKLLIDQMSIRLMVCGNLFACGEYGFVHRDDISREEAIGILNKGLNRLHKSTNGDKPCVNLIKEFPSERQGEYSELMNDKFQMFSIDHNMVLKLHENWSSSDDYLSSMTSKFRTKVKSILKKSKDLKLEDWSVSDILEYEKEIFSLYENVVDNAEFNLGVLEIGSFAAMKNGLGEAMKFNAYTRNGKLLGFSIAFLNKDYLDAGFVGFDYELNEELAIYRRMLYDLVKIGIDHGVKEIHFGRTAEQLKSNFGAEPREMTLMVRHRNSIANHIVKGFVNKIKPSNFELRRPFKAEFETAWTH